MAMLLFYVMHAALPDKERGKMEQIVSISQKALEKAVIDKIHLERGTKPGAGKHFPLCVLSAHPVRSPFMPLSYSLRPRNREALPESTAYEIRVLTARKCTWKLDVARKGEQCRLRFRVSERKGLSGLTMNYSANNKFKNISPMVITYWSNYFTLFLFLTIS